MLASAIGFALLIVAGCSAQETQTGGPGARLAAEEPTLLPTPEAQVATAPRPDWLDGPKSDSIASTRQPSNVFACNSDRHEQCDR
jgi:hypothetical protein